MNKIFKTVTMCLCGAAVLSSCSDWLETTSTSLNDNDKTFTSPALTELAVNKAYGYLCGNNYTQLMTIHQGAGTDVELIDGIGSTATAASERGAMNYNATSGGWNKLGTLWEEQYATIQACNLIIDGIEKNEANIKAQGETTALTMLKYYAEATTIRAMVYLDLVRVFGDVPLMLHSSNSDLSNVNVGKTGRDEILDSLIVSLDAVVNSEVQALPDAGSVTTEHITQGYAEALLANIYMTRAGYAIREAANGVNADYCVDALKKLGYVKAEYSDDVYQTMRPSDDDCHYLYEKAAQYLAKVIKKGNYSMNSSFENLWANINALKTDDSHECMFEIPMGFGNTGELGYTVGVRLNGVTNDYGYGNSSGKLKTTAVQLYSYGTCDTRRDITCVPYEIKNFERTAANGSTTTIETCLGNKPFGLYIGKWDVRKMSDQWLSTNKTATAKFGYGINVVRMRYPQVLLWYAECMAQLGYLNSDPYGCGLTAIQAVEKVHERAYNDAKTNYLGTSPAEELAEWKTEMEAVSSTEEMMKKIRQENQLEFCGEGFRKWDLIRWNMLHEVIWTGKTNYKKFCGADGTRAIDKIYYKYKDYTEKQIDPASITWYGMPDGDVLPTASKKGKSPSNDWLQDNGYRYPKGTGASAGQGTDAKGFNADSYTKAGFGQAYSNEDSELNTICGGLVGTQKVNSSNDECKDEGVTVKNRYLMPIYDNTIQSSNGRLYNSYGY